MHYYDEEEAAEVEEHANIAPQSRPGKRHRQAHEEDERPANVVPQSRKRTRGSDDDEEAAADPSSVTPHLKRHRQSADYEEEPASAARKAKSSHGNGEYYSQGEEEEEEEEERFRNTAASKIPYRSVAYVEEDEDYNDGGSLYSEHSSPLERSQSPGNYQEAFV